MSFHIQRKKWYWLRVFIPTEKKSSKRENEKSFQIPKFCTKKSVLSLRSRFFLEFQKKHRERVDNRHNYKFYYPKKSIEQQTR